MHVLKKMLSGNTAHLFYGSPYAGFVSVIKGEGSSGDGASEARYESF